jgi:hypothetical protein
MSQQSTPNDADRRRSFDAGCEIITGQWEVLIAESEWRPWMDITLAKQAL